MLHTSFSVRAYVASIAFLHRGEFPGQAEDRLSDARKEWIVDMTSDRWLGLAYRWLMPLALVAAIGVAAVTVISARSADSGRHDAPQVFSEGDEESEDKDCVGGKRSGKFTELAELVGTDLEGLKTALGEGKTLAEIAGENDIDAQTVIDALVERADERIDSAVEAGKLTEAEAETKKSEAAEKIEDWVNNGFDRERFRGWGKGRWRGHGHGFGGGVESS